MRKYAAARTFQPRGPMMNSQAANTDAALKIAAVDEGFAGSQPFHEMVGFDEATMAKLESEKRKENIVNPGTEWRDLFAYDPLSANGIRIETRPKPKRNGVSDIDLHIDDQLVEVKSPSGSGERQVKNAFTSAKDQFARQDDSSNPARIVFNGYYSGRSDEWIADEIKKRMKTVGGILEVIQVHKDGSVRRFRAKE